MLFYYFYFFTNSFTNYYSIRQQLFMAMADEARRWDSTHKPFIFCYNLVDLRASLFIHTS